MIPIIGMTIIFPIIIAIVVLVDNKCFLLGFELDLQNVFDKFIPKIIMLIGTAACPVYHFMWKGRYKGETVLCELLSNE